MAKIFGNMVGVPNPKPDWNETDETKANAILNKPTKLSQFEDDIAYKEHTHIATDIVYLTEDSSVSHTLEDVFRTYDDGFSDLYPRVNSLEDNKAGKSEVEALADYTEQYINGLSTDIGNLFLNKADKPSIKTSANTTYVFDFSNNYNNEVRLTAPSAISIKFVDDEYADDYISGLSFNSGDTPTGFDYTASGIINWVGTDCTKDGDLSIFQPSANTHYDIVFYFNGSQFIGLVNGFVPATGNVVSV